MASIETFRTLKSQYVCNEFQNNKWSIVRTLEQDNPSDSLQLVIHPANLAENDTIFCFPSSFGAADMSQKRVAFCVKDGGLNTIFLIALRNGSMTLFKVSASGFDEELSCPRHTNRLKGLQNLRTQAVQANKSDEFLVTNYVNIAWGNPIAHPFWKDLRPAPITPDDLGLGFMDVIQPTVSFFS